MMLRKKIYLDHAAATPVDRRVISAMKPYLRRIFGNPGSLHANAVQASQAVSDARATAAQALGARPEEITFVAGGTESNNLAIIGSVHAYTKNNPGVVPHIVVSAIEHKAVLATVRALRDAGEIELSEIPVDYNGVIDLA